jgi:tyramine---L-glutamate ligase
MRVFISEFVSGGGWPEPEICGSLAREGRAMLCAVAADFARIPDVRVTTTWDARLGSPSIDNVHTIVVESSEDELPIFRELADLCDATLVIAPETHGMLAQRCRIVEGTRGRLLGPGSRAVGICTDKLETFRCLEQGGVPTIPTVPLHFSPAIRPDVESEGPSAIESTGFPLVVKPIDGAGSQSTWLIRNVSEFERLRPLLASDPNLATAICQPYVRGRAISVGILISPDRERMEVFPVAEQTLSDDGRFRYLGGVIPARAVKHATIALVAQEACRAIPGLRGYVGVDMVVPESNPERPVVVEINPRLTTSYVGYRQLTETNVAERILGSGDACPIVWRKEGLSFTVCGQVPQVPAAENNRRCGH